MKISDKDFDKLISVAMSQVPDDDDIELKTDEELSLDGNSTHEFSPAFEKQMKKLIRKSRKQQYNEYRPTGFHSKIRIAVLIAVLVCAATMFSVGAFRTSIANFFFDLEGKSSDIKFDDTNDSISPEFDKYLPVYVPDGFVVDNVRENIREGIFIELSNGNGQFYDVNIEMNPSNVSFDTEDGITTEIEFDNAKATITERDDRCIATYTDGNKFYSIAGNISSKELLKILESIPNS